MKKVEVDPISIIIIVIGILIMGITISAVGVGKFLIKKFKILLAELRAVQKKELEDARKESQKLIDGKDEIISEQQKIIDQLLELFHVKDDHGRCIADTYLGRISYNRIVKQRSRLN